MSHSDNDGCGCLSLIALCLVVWALFFGVTIGGKHYGLSCTRKEGVRIDH